MEARLRAIARKKQMGIDSFFQKGESSNMRFLRGPEQGTNGGRGSADDRTIFLTFSRGYPVSRAEVHASFWVFSTKGEEDSPISVFPRPPFEEDSSFWHCYYHHWILSPVYQVGHQVYLTNLTSFPNFCQLQCRKT
ncbi:Uncharacterized protein Rs2_04431 [Raphanus sativus]|nr:Uncharacterized protein Rs2_04431 [Raphanus sativus]